MSNVLKNQRPSSPFLVLTHALNMRKEMTQALLIDFGYHPEPIDYPDLPDDFEEMEEWQKKNVLYKQEKLINRLETQEELRWWFLDKSRNAILDCIMQLIKNIALANAVYITNMDEYRERRIYQNRAIGCCGVLAQELQYLIETIPVDTNKYTRFDKMITEQINLLKGWRKSDNKVKKQLEKK